MVRDNCLRPKSKLVGKITRHVTSPSFCKIHELMRWQRAELLYEDVLNLPQKGMTMVLDQVRK